MRRVDSIVLNPEIVAVFGGEKPALPVGGCPDQVALLEFEQVHGAGRVAVGPGAITSAPDQPIGDRAQPAQEMRLNPEHVQRVLVHGASAKLAAATRVGRSGQSLTTRSERTPCWHRPCGERSRGE